MNAPSGVDTDTSGEEVTPPPSPIPEKAKPSFSLTSTFLPLKRLKDKKKKDSNIKAQTPEQAAESEMKTDPPTSSRLRKKRVMITEKHIKDDMMTTVGPDAEPESQAPLVQIDAPKTSDSTQVIEVLRQLLAKNTLDDQVADGSSEPNPKHATTIIEKVDSSFPLWQKTLPDTPKRRPSGLDLSGLFQSRRRQKKTFMAEHESGQSSDTKTSLDTPQGNKGQPATSNEPTQFPPPWLWTVPGQQTLQASTPSAHVGTELDNEAKLRTPPWLWNGAQSAAVQSHLSQQQQTPAPFPYSAGPSSYYPPFPPVYPHPASLQPWHPYYSNYYSPPHPSPDGRQGMTGAMAPGQEQSSAPLDPLRNPWSPSTRAMGAQGSTPANAGAASSELEADAPKMKISPAQAKTPKPLKVESIAESVRPVRGSTSLKDDRPAAVDGRVRTKIAKTQQTLRRTAADQDAPKLSSSDKVGVTTWSECLLSLATCIHLCESLGRAIKERDNDANPLQRVLSKLLAGLLLQRDVVKEMQGLVGDAHGGEISRFVYELHTIKSFLGHCLKSKARSDKDGKRLSQMHEDASRALETGGMAQLLHQAFLFIDMLTPSVIKAISDLVRDWIDHKLTVKGVMKNLMVIQHEVMEVLRSREKDRSKSKDEAGKSWTIMKSLDLMYKLFASDPHSQINKGIPGAWPSDVPPKSDRSARQNHPAHRHDTSEANPHTRETRSHISRHDRKEGTDDHEPKRDKSSHRNPKEVISDLIHPTKDAKSDTMHTPTRTKVDRMTEGRDLHRQDMKEGPLPAKMETVQPPSDKLATPVGQVPTYRTPPLRVKKRPAGTSLAPATPLSPDSPQSSPSQYSEHESELDSVGTVSSDEEAESLLAQADSGPMRKKDRGKKD